MTRSAFFLSLLILPCLMAFHPFYMAVVEAEYKTKTKEFGISCKVFPDDMEEALEKFSGKKPDIRSGNKNEINKLFESYFSKHLKAKINGKLIPVHYLGYENENEATFIYFNLTNIAPPKSIGLFCDVMYEYKEEQANIIHLIVDGKRKSFKATAPLKEVLF